MKRVFLIGIGIVFTCLSNNLFAQTKQQDSAAILIIDRMSDVIGELKSCSYKLSTTTDVSDVSFGLIKVFNDFDVHISGPNKMLASVQGYRGHRQYMYNGDQMAYYSYDENNYGILPAPPTILSTIDSLHFNYGIDFPAADFFYPAFTDDLIEEADIIRYLGIVIIQGKEYFHIAASGKEKNFEFWIDNDAYNLPSKFVITDKTQKGNPQYQASFSDWKINPVLPASMFDFLPPPGAREVRILSKSNK